MGVLMIHHKALSRLSQHLLGREVIMLEYCWLQYYTITFNMSVFSFLALVWAPLFALFTYFHKGILIPILSQVVHVIMSNVDNKITCSYSLASPFIVKLTLQQGPNYDGHWGSAWKKWNVQSYKHTHMHRCSQIQIHTHTHLTPAYASVQPEEFSLLSKGEYQQSLQVQALYKKPEEVGQDTVLEESHRCFTFYLMDGKQISITTTFLTYTVHRHLDLVILTVCGHRFNKSITKVLYTFYLYTAFNYLLCIVENIVVQAKATEFGEWPFKSKQRVVSTPLEKQMCMITNQRVCSKSECIIAP